MEPQANFLSVQRTARFFTLGDASGDAQRLIFACHGYGQLAGQFIYKFTEQLDSATLVVAPEALSRLYLDQTYSRIGASWMTREDRDHEIADYCAYLTRLFGQISAQSVSPQARSVFFGFSQGCTTLTRWMVKERPPFDALVLWGGAFADDMDYLACGDYFSGKKIFVVFGDADPFVTPDQVAKLNDFARAQGLVYEVVSFPGKHEIDRSVLTRVLAGL